MSNCARKILEDASGGGNKRIPHAPTIALYTQNTPLSPLPPPDPWDDVIITPRRCLPHIEWFRRQRERVWADDGKKTNARTTASLHTGARARTDRWRNDDGDDDVIYLWKTQKQDVGSTSQVTRDLGGKKTSKVVTGVRVLEFLV